MMRLTLLTLVIFAIGGARAVEAQLARYRDYAIMTAPGTMNPDDAQPFSCYCAE